MAVFYFATGHQELHIHQEPRSADIVNVFLLNFFFKDHYFFASYVLKVKQKCRKLSSLSKSFPSLYFAWVELQWFSKRVNRFSWKNTQKCFIILSCKVISKVRLSQNEDCFLEIIPGITRKSYLFMLFIWWFPIGFKKIYMLCNSRI